MPSSSRSPCTWRWPPGSLHSPRAQPAYAGGRSGGCSPSSRPATWATQDRSRSNYLKTFDDERSHERHSRIIRRTAQPSDPGPASEAADAGDASSLGRTSLPCVASWAGFRPTSLARSRSACTRCATGSRVVVDPRDPQSHYGGRGAARQDHPREPEVGSLTRGDSSTQDSLRGGRVALSTVTKLCPYSYLFPLIPSRNRVTIWIFSRSVQASNLRVGGSNPSRRTIY
jgi:hypothetical protein